MWSYCVVKNCKARGRRNFYQIPREPTLRAIWLQRIRRRNLFSLNSKQLTQRRVCIAHFEKQCLAECSVRNTLKYNALPTKLLPINYDPTYDNCFHNWDNPDKQEKILPINDYLPAEPVRQVFDVDTNDDNHNESNHVPNDNVDENIADIQLVVIPTNKTDEYVLQFKKPFKINDKTEIWFNNPVIQKEDNTDNTEENTQPQKPVILKGKTHEKRFMSEELSSITQDVNITGSLKVGKQSTSEHLPRKTKTGHLRATKILCKMCLKIITKRELRCKHCNTRLHRRCIRFLKDITIVDDKFVNCCKELDETTLNAKSCLDLKEPTSLTEDINKMNSSNIGTKGILEYLLRKTNHLKSTKVCKKCLKNVLRRGLTCKHCNNAFHKRCLRLLKNVTIIDNKFVNCCKELDETILNAKSCLELKKPTSLTEDINKMNSSNIGTEGILEYLHRKPNHLKSAKVCKRCSKNVQRRGLTCKHCNTTFHKRCLRLLKNVTIIDNKFVNCCKELDETTLIVQSGVELKEPISPTQDIKTTSLNVEKKVILEYLHHKPENDHLKAPKVCIKDVVTIIDNKFVNSRKEINDTLNNLLVDFETTINNSSDIKNDTLDETINDNESDPLTQVANLTKILDQRELRITKLEEQLRVKTDKIVSRLLKATLVTKNNKDALLKKKNVRIKKLQDLLKAKTENTVFKSQKCTKNLGVVPRLKLQYTSLVIPKQPFVPVNVNLPQEQLIDFNNTSTEDIAIFIADEHNYSKSARDFESSFLAFLDDVTKKSEDVKEN